jgi:thiol:disulfide interchange protein DsbC
MKRLFARIGLGLITATLFFGNLALAETPDEELKRVREKVSGTFKEIEPQHVIAGPIDGWYTVAKGAIVAYISADGRYLLQGELIDLDQNINLTENARSVARVEMMAAIPDDELIIFTPEEVKHTISVFTDIDCTFCRRLHSQIDDYLAQGIQVRYLLYPRNGPASASWVKAEKVWCSDDRNSALTQAKQDQEFQTRDCDASVVHSHYAAGQDVGLRGTPAIVTEDGTLVSGYMDPTELSNALASAKE